MAYDYLNNDGSSPVARGKGAGLLNPIRRSNSPTRNIIFGDDQPDQQDVLPRVGLDIDSKQRQRSGVNTNRPAGSKSGLSSLLPQ